MAELPTGLPYGERSRLEGAQRAVPSTGGGGGMAALPPDPNTTGLNDPPPGIGLSAPSQFPTEPVTTGADVGPGAGPEALMNVNPPPDPDEAVMAALVPMLEAVVDNKRMTSQRAKQLVRRYRSQLPVR